MNIIKMAGVNLRLPLSVTVFLGTAILSAGQAYAGFQSLGPDEARMPNQNVQMDGTPVNEDSQPKALEIFNDRYVPDTLRRKYQLDDNWYSKGQPVSQPAKTTDPVQLTPHVLEVTEVPKKEVPTLSSKPPVKILAITPPKELPVVEAQSAIEPQVPITRYARLPVENAPAKTNPVPKKPIETWRARKGENIHAVLQRWSERGETNLMWASPDAPVLQKEFTFIGKFQDAVNALIKAEGGDKIHSQYRSEGLDPVMMTPASTVTTNVVQVEQEQKPVNPLAQIFQPDTKKDIKPETRWFALSGAPLAEVIQVWADDADVKLIWQSEKNFAVKESISQIGHFEDAIFRALSQYDAEQVRPVGEMYTDPQSGQKVLFVRTDVN